MCMLNLSHCLLKLGKAGDAAEEASAVLALDKRSLKAYYRRCVVPRADVTCCPCCVCARAGCSVGAAP